jgi:hypothetical protein
MDKMWKNLYPGNNSGVHIASDNPADIYQLVASILETIGDCDGSVTRTGALEALAIAGSVLSSLENPVSKHGPFSDDNHHDINSENFTTDLSSRVPRL